MPRNDGLQQALEKTSVSSKNEWIIKGISSLGYKEETLFFLPADCLQTQLRGDVRKTLEKSWGEGRISEILSNLIYITEVYFHAVYSMGSVAKIKCEKQWST